MKAEGDEQSTNLYVSNLPKDMTETVSSILSLDVLRLTDGQNRSWVLFSWIIQSVLAESFGTVRATAVVSAFHGKWHPKPMRYIH